MSQAKIETMILKSPVGPIQIQIEDDHIINTEYLIQIKHPSFEKHSTSIYQQSINDYFSDPNYKFSFRLKLSGTDFQKKVWRALQKIPAGEVRTYGELALQLNSSARAVGNACRKNPIPLIIPCHRVVAKNHIGGFSGNTKGPMIGIKQYLLKHENSL